MAASSAFSRSPRGGRSSRTRSTPVSTSSSRRCLSTARPTDRTTSRRCSSRSWDIRAHARRREGVALGDEVKIAEESVLMPGVRVYPYKEVESGAQIYESLIWESRASSRLFERDSVSGLVNVDLTPEVVTKLAVALGTALPRGARIVASREAPAACRMIERAMIAGLNSTGVDVSDLRVLPSAVGRHLLKTHDYAAGFHVGSSSVDPEVVAIRFFEEPGIQLTTALQKEVEKHFARGEPRRAAGDGVGNVDYPVRAREVYAEELLETLDQDAIRERDFRIVVDYGHSAASLVLPLVLGPLAVEVVAAHAFSPSGDGGPRASLRSLIGQTKKLVNAVGADFGVVFDRAAERLYLVDESGREIPV